MKTLLCFALALTSCALPTDDHELELDAIEQSAEVALTSADKALIDAPDGVWRDVTFDNTQCRDGSPITVRVHRNKKSDKLVIFMEGGGICFDEATCAASDPNVRYQLDTQWDTLDGLLNLDNPTNPVRDWNFVYVPYCSGDLWGGTRKDVNIPNVGKQQFVGRSNLQRLLRPLTRLGKAPGEVLLVGVSAGGFGATISLPPIQKAFSDEFGRKAPKVRLVNDSGAFVDKSSLAVCLQQAWRTTFGWDNSFLADWPEGKKYRGGEFMAQYATWVAKTYDQRQNGFLETIEDGVIRGFYGIGQENCTGVFFETPIDGPTFTNSLLNFRKAVKGTTTSTFYLQGGEHVSLEYESFYTLRAGNASLVDWFTRLVKNQRGGDYGP